MQAADRQPSGRTRRDRRIATAAAAAVVAAGWAAGPAWADPTLTTLGTFYSGRPDASAPTLLNGNLYWTAYGSPYVANGGGDYGSVQRVSVNGGAVATVASFTGTNGATVGANPRSGVVADASGNLYGTTFNGGPNRNGTVFQIPAGTGTVNRLVSFTLNNGSQPWGDLTLDAAGNVYGTSSTGGANGNGYGTVFKVPAGGSSLTTLATFTNANGAGPEAGLLLDPAAGYLYGTTFNGGPTNNGTAFRVPLAGGAVTTLAAFDGTNGAHPRATLIADANGNLLGTTSASGSGSYGTVFSLAASGAGSPTTLAAFDGSAGRSPLAGLLADAAGDLFGTTSGAGGSATVFVLPAGGGPATTLATLPAGTVLANRLIADAAGTLYGTSITSGGDGSVFKLTGAGFVVGNSGPQPVSVAAGQTYHFAAVAGSTVTARTVPGLTVAAGGTAVVDAAATASGRQVLVVTGPGLTLAGSAGNWTGLLDLTNNDLDVPNGSLATITSQAAQGFTGGRLNGSGGIASSTAAADTGRLTAVGVIQNVVTLGGTTAIYTSFDGQAVAATDVLARYTYYGDANLDGRVDAADYTRIDAGFLTKLTGWQSGDFNYDGRVDASDYTLMDNAFNRQAGGVASPTTSVAGRVAAVPEPASLAAVAGVGLLAGRRRR